MTPRRTLFILLLVLGLASVSTIAQTQTFDVLVRGGQILDGSGNPWTVGDVGIKGDRIAAVGRLPGAAATLYLDFDGDVTSSWGSYHPGTTPAFDQDGDPTTVSELRAGMLLSGDAGAAGASICGALEDAA